MQVTNISQNYYIINNDNTITYIRDLQSMTYCHYYDIKTYSAMTS